jgi:hypothetical protein
MISHSFGISVHEQLIPLFGLVVGQHNMAGVYGGAKFSPHGL